MKTLTAIALAAALLTPSTKADAMELKVLAPMFLPCVAASAVARKHNYGASEDNTNILYTYGFMALVVMGHDIDPTAVEAAQEALYQNDRPQFIRHYLECVKGTNHLMAVTRQGMTEKLAAMGY